jgi:hypothetical protein
MNITKTFGEFAVYEEFTKEGKESAINIKILIDYANKTYDIYPSHAKTFAFINGGKNAAKWKTIAGAIVSAVTFAEKELKELNNI